MHTLDKVCVCLCVCVCVLCVCVCVCCLFVCVCVSLISLDCTLRKGLARHRERTFFYPGQRRRD